MQSQEKNFEPIGFWSPKPALLVAARPRLWRSIFHAPVSVRFEESEWSRFPPIVRWSYSAKRNDGRLCLSFSCSDTYQRLADRWRAVANSLWRLIRRHPGISFDEVPVDIGDCGDASVPLQTFRFVRSPGDPHALIPNPYLLGWRQRLPAPLAWNRKKDSVYFRGTLTGMAQSWDNPRAVACRVSKAIPNADCKVTRFVQTPSAFVTELQRESLVAKPDRASNLNYHRYLLDIDGNTSSWHRYWLSGMFRAVPIRFESQWEECWHTYLREGENCVVATRHTLAAVVDHLRSDQKRAKAIAKAAAVTARDQLSPAGVQMQLEQAWLSRLRSGGARS